MFLPQSTVTAGFYRLFTVLTDSHFPVSFAGVFDLQDGLVLQVARGDERAAFRNRFTSIVFLPRRAAR